MRKLAPYAGGMVGLLVLTSPAIAADFEPPVEEQLCAVSDVNGKVAGGGGYYEDAPSFDDGLGFGEASISIPLGCQFGLQIDGAGGVLGESEFGGVAGHLFTRDPSSFLFGAFGSYSNIDGIDIGRVGAEGHLYLDRISLEGLVGFEDVEFIGDDVFVSAVAAYYPTDNFRISAGYRRFLTIDAAVFAAEWQVDELNLGAPVTLFAEGQIGVDDIFGGAFPGINDDYIAVFGGLRVYFGERSKTLIRRHREDDPINPIVNLLANVCAGSFPTFEFPEDGLVQDDGVPEGILVEGANKDGQMKRPVKKISFTDSCGRPTSPDFPEDGVITPPIDDGFIPDQ